MEQIMVFDEKMKTRTGIICLIPIVCFTFCLAYYLTLVFAPSPEAYSPLNILGVTSRNYGNMFMILAISSVITASVLIYCMVILTRLKGINSATKTIWIIFLSIAAPIAIAAFWLIIIRQASKVMPVYNSID